MLREQDPEIEPVPFLLPAVTDARFFDRLGIQAYGFPPMDLPEGFALLETVHSGDERIPARSVAFGAEATGKVLPRYGEGISRAGRPSGPNADRVESAPFCRRPSSSPNGRARVRR